MVLSNGGTVSVDVQMIIPDPNKTSIKHFT